MKKFFLPMCALIISSCASEHKMKDISSPLEEKGQISSSEKLGLNTSGEAIVQEKQRADIELKGWIWQNNTMEQEVNSTRYELKRCREESSDVRLGGSGEVVELPDVDNLKPTLEVKEKLGLINNDIMVVKETYLKDRLKVEKEYSSALESMMKIIKKHKEKCDFSLSQKRVKAGLPAKKTQGKFAINPDGTLNQVVERHEKNLDDAFEMKKSREPATEDSQTQVEQ